VRTVPLRPGFNYVRAQRWMEDAPFPMEINALLMESADVRERRILYLPDTIAAYEFAVTLTPAALTVPTERSGTITASVTASQTTALLWSVVGGADFGTVTAETNGARYTAPSRPPAGGVLVRAASSLDPNRSSTTPVTVLPGIRIVAAAASGTPAVPALPSANAGQAVEVQIPPEAFAITQAGFAGVQVEVPTLRPAAAGGCERGVLPVAAVVAPGLQSLTATLPACASPRGWVRVPGHGSAELQVVPVVTSFEGDRASEPYVTVRGTGFACGETQVVIGGTPLPAAEVQAVTCGSLRLATWPAQGAMLSVRTVGGESVPVPVP
jgi:hypothetical protein